MALRISKPRARISRSENRGKPFSALGELLWYLAGDNTLEFIAPYVPKYRDDAEEGILHGAYGPRLFAMKGIDQFNNIEKLLAERKGSRRAVIQLFNAEDINAYYKEIPCTTTLQFHLRDNLLHLSVTLRSNDAYWGLPHDVFCFTMIQEMMAQRLNVELGEYYQYVGSMHVYKDYVDGVKDYVNEGVQRTIEMPCMPKGNPFTMIDKLLSVERKIRTGESVRAMEEVGNPYWADIVRLLQVFWAKEATTEYVEKIRALRAEMASDCYRSYIDGRLQVAHKVSGI